MTLTLAQQSYVDAAFPECRDLISDYLERGVEVIVLKQNECGDDVPPFAVAPKDNQEFWLGCWDSPDEAATVASSLGLCVVWSSDYSPGLMQDSQCEKMTKEQMIEDRVKLAEKQVHVCLNYGGLFHDGGPTTKVLNLAYEQGDLIDEVAHMRRFASALTALAEALAAKQASLD